MRHKAVWICFWMTLTYWLGGVFGCSSLDQQAAPLPQPNTPRVAKVATKSVTEARSSIHTFSRMTSESQPSIHSLDRSHWPKVTVKPLDGSLSPRPLLFEDVVIKMEDPVTSETAQDDDPMSHQAVDLSEVKLPAEDFSRVNKNTVEVQKNLVEAMEGGEAQNWSKENSVSAVAQPIKAALDLVTLPFHAIADKKNDTPDESEQAADTQDK